jgi:N-acetyl-gamma-glutamyl-phosphate reductase
MRPKVYIDGHVGTTGLRIRDWLAGRDDLELLTLREDRRKDDAARRERLLAADLAVLCLPDAAAQEAARWADAGGVRVLDASSAHRVTDGWVYGLPELLPEQRDAIAAAPRVSNAGCYPTGLLLLVRPLVDAGLLPATAPLAVHALSGYSGGGRPLIERWEDPGSGLPGLPFEAPYALDAVHKHVPEMHHYSGLARAPQFVPSVGPFACGIRLQIPLPAGTLTAGASGKSVWEVLAQRYEGEAFVRVIPIAEPLGADERSFDPRTCNDTNRIELRVLPHPSGHMVLMAIYDNLGKGAAGVAIQNLNRMLGCEEARGLRA